MLKLLVLTIAFALGLVISSPGQSPKTTLTLGKTARQALNYFAQMDKHPSEFLRSIRMNRIAPEFKQKVLNLIPLDSLVKPSAEEQVKLRSLSPILKYHERDSVI